MFRVAWPCLNLQVKPRISFLDFLENYLSSVRSQKTRIFDFHIFQERQKTENILLGVSYIAESQAGLY